MQWLWLSICNRVSDFIDTRVVYSYADSCRTQRHTIKTRDTIKKYTSHFIWKVWQGYSRFYCERGLETEQNCNILTPTIMAISFVSFSFSRAAQPEAQRPSFLLSAGFLYNILSLTHLTPTNWLPVYTELYNCSIAHSILGMACFIVIKRK